MFQMNKFYVGARHIAKGIENKTNAEWSRATVEGAIQHAKELMEDEDIDTAIVVQIIRVIRRAKNPVFIEKVK